MSKSDEANSGNDTISVADTLCDQPTSFLDDEKVLRLNHSNMAHFKIIDILGRGGMGAVYKAKDLALERFVAIKMIRVSNAEQPLMLTEAKTISKLNHINIVTIYDIARDDDANFIVMEWVNGQPLNAIIPAEGLSVHKVLAYAKQIVSAIACAHQHKIIHRDIKPQNIMLDENGCIKILDFGIAALIDSVAFSTVDASANSVTDSDATPASPLVKAERLNTQHIAVEPLPNSNFAKNTTSASQQQATEIIGTPQYMSPEQILGQALDTRSDLFSVGVVLYEMLTGVKPFSGLNVKEITQAVTSGQYTPIAEQKAAEHKATEQKSAQSTSVEQKQSDDDKEKSKKEQSKASVAIPPELIAIVDKLLQVDPNQRYQSTQALAQDINLLDNSINRKKNWWQKQHSFTKILLAMPVVIILAWSITSIIFPPSTQELVARQLIESKKIAFLPFDNLSGDPVLQLFSDGVATMLSSDLAEVGYQQGDGTTWVVPASEIRKLEAATVAGVYNQYGVDVVITGSIQHMGSTRSLHLNLVNGVDGRQLKSLQLSLDANNLFAAQKQIRQQVLSLLGWHIPEHLAEQFAAKKPNFDGAYKYYLEGQGYLYRFDYQDNIENAVSAFEQAISLDDQYADAYVGLAQAQLRRFIEYQQLDHLTAMAATVQHLMKLDSNHSLINYLYGELMLQQGEYQAAVVLFKESIKQYSQFMKAYTSMAEAYQNLHELAKAENILLSAYQLKPRNNTILGSLGLFYYKNGDYSKALTYFELLAKQAPNNYTAYLNISACYYLNGDFQQALVAANKSLAIEQNVTVYSNLGTYYFMLRYYKKSVIAFEKMIALNNSDYVNWGNLADAYRFAKNNKHVQTFQKAITLAEQALTLNPNNKYTISLLTYYYANLNDVEQTHFYANKVLGQAGGVEHFFIAAAYARLNMKTEAVKYLTIAIENNYSSAEISDSPLFDNLKGHADYINLLSSTSSLNSDDK